MPNATLQPFKAYFEYHFEGSISELFTDSLEIYLNRTSEDSLTVSTEHFLKKYLTSFNLPIFKSDMGILFKYESCNLISPVSFPVDSLTQSIQFKVKSEIVEILQISGDEITFVNSKKEVITKSLTNRLELAKV